MTFTVQVKGLRELEKKLQGLPFNKAKGVLFAAAASAAKPIRASAASMAPVGDNSRHAVQLSEGVVSGRKLSGRQARLHRWMFKKEPDMKSTVEYYVGATEASLNPHAHMQEFGTRHNAAQPYMRPAWEQNKSRTLDTIVQKIAEHIRKKSAGGKKR